MPKRTDITTILIIGAGPIVIGQACEFDYSGTQAVKTLKEEGYRIVLVNSNPATIMTDPELADATYIEPITPEIVAKIIEKERHVIPGGFALLPTMGGQTALNCALSLRRQGTLEKFDVEMIGATADAIDKAEDRQLFREAMTKIGLETPKSRLANASELKKSFRDKHRAEREKLSGAALEEHERQWVLGESDRRKRYQEYALGQALMALSEIGLPAIIRPSFTMGGTGGGIAYNKEEFLDIIERGLDASPTNEVLIEESVLGWKEYEMEVVRDKKDNCIIVCSIENLDPMGVHTGDSITVAPALTLTDKEYQIMRDASLAVLREIGVETGGSNVQFGVNPEDGRMVVIEMNPRVSRSSALASKATGFPIAKVAAKLAVGYTLDEIANDITGGATPASFEPTIDYVVTKIPRFAFEKFPGASTTLTTSMKSVGEVMAIGRTFQESLQKALRGLETGLTGLDEIEIEGLGQHDDKNAIRAALGTPTPNRLLQVAQAMRLGWSNEDIFNSCKIDPWFLSEMRGIVDMEEKVRKNGLPGNAFGMRTLKAMGFSDARLAVLAETTEAEVTAKRHALGVRPVYKRIDTCAAEFASPTAYMYSTYEALFAGAPADESSPSDKKKVIILGGGPNRIGQGIEFDYCCCHACFALHDAGYESIMVNCNPGDGVDRLRHRRPALFRAAHRRGRAGDHREGAHQRHAARRDRAVRRPDPAEAGARAGSRRSADPRHLARRHRPCRRPRPLQARARQAPARSSRRTASPIRSSRRAWSQPISACRWWCARPTCSAAARCRSSARRTSSATICSARCRSWCRPTSRRATRTTRPGRSTPCSARTRCCSTAICPTPPRSTSTASATARTPSSSASWSTSRKPASIPATAPARCRRTRSMPG